MRPARQGQGDSMQYVKVDIASKARGRDTLLFADAENVVREGGSVGFILENNLYLLDLDATVPEAKFVADYIISRYPDIIVFKTPKAGGYHFLFRSPSDIKAGVGFMTIFGFPMDIKKARGHAILPDNFPGRSYYNGCTDITSFEERMKDYGVFISPQELRALIPYAKEVFNVVDLTALPEGTRNDTIFKWLCRWARFRGATELNRYAPVISKIAHFSLKEIQNAIKSIDRYVAAENVDMIEEEELGDLVVGKDLLELSVHMLDYIRRTGVMKYDICTGNYSTTLQLAHDKLLSQLDMWNYFRIYFKDHAKYKLPDKNGELKLAPVNDVDLRTIFDFISKHITFNSRLKDYEAIPEWDGQKRIDSFMKDFYDCDANPNFFRLLMTSLVGKMKDPAGCYVPFFFDLVGAKGTGKSLLFRRLLGERYYTTIIPSQREDDVCVNIYSKGAVIAVDDECILTQGKGFNVWSEDKLKNFVTLAEDTFARKFQNVEYHPRGFVLCRTSNYIKTATDTDERRQIIFESGLPPRECRILKLPEDFFVQLRAEAKAYYEKYGVYKLTPEDWSAVEAQQIDYIDEDNKFVCDIKDFLASAFEDYKARNERWYSNKPGGAFVTWQHYKNWYEFKNGRTDPMSGMLFWKNMRIVAQKSRYIDIPARRACVAGKPQQIAFLLLSRWEESQRKQKDAGLVPPKLTMADDVFEGLED